MSRRVIDGDVIEDWKFEISLGTCGRCGTNIGLDIQFIGNGVYCLRCSIDIYQHIT